MALAVRLVQAHPLGDGDIGFAIGTGQHELCALHQAMGRGVRIGEAHEMSALFVAQLDERLGRPRGIISIRVGD